MQNITANGTKKIKDPLYGYIPIEFDFIQNIIDTPIFQRLRRVMQTSYSPLYSSSLHNRFVHSLGVFYLGSIVANRLKKVILEDNSFLSDISFDEKKDVINKIAHIYRIACLLHDIGHAPFSHTGEIYYIYYKDGDNTEVTRKRLHEKLYKMLKSERFKDDLPLESDGAAAHELMSAIVGIKEFSSLIGDLECQEFFSRCITGYTYKSTNQIEDIKNCFILMLNSKVIDVDRLDYLIRDAYTSGFATINIDYIRLLNALTVKDYNDKIRLAYNKDAISVIENVVYAHDAEKKWIQNHPVVLYETYIIKHILQHLGDKLNAGENRLFSEESLSDNGHTLRNDVKVSLMCDDDIIYLSKNVFSDELSKEFFDRNKRRHPVWKSEAEYESYIRSNRPDEEKELFKTCIDSFNESNIPDYPVPQIINDNLLRKLIEELDEAKKAKSASSRALTRKVNVCKYLHDYSIKHKIPFDYIIIPTSMFFSSFSKKHLSNVLVNFEGKRPYRLKEVCKLLSAQTGDDKDFYYLFYRRGKETEDTTGKIDDIAGFCDGLINACFKDDKYS